MTKTCEGYDPKTVGTFYSHETAEWVCPYCAHRSLNLSDIAAPHSARYLAACAEAEDAELSALAAKALAESDGTVIPWEDIKRKCGL